MTDIDDRLEAVFRVVLELDPEIEVTEVTRETFDAWDSLAHVLLVAGVENEFEVVVDLMDALELTSYGHFRAFLEGRLEDSVPHGA